MVCILKEPFFKCATDGTYSLRVNHPGDIIWLDGADDRIPSHWRPSMVISGGNSTDIRKQGNDAVQSKKWAEALRLYSSAIQAGQNVQERQLAFLNRSFINMNMDRTKQALLDAEKATNPAMPSEKSLFRKARALYELGDYQQSLEMLEKLTQSYPENKAASPEKDRLNERLNEQRTGKYKFKQMYKQAEKTPPLIDCATFSAPVEIRESPGRGKGLFTTKAVSAGELLLCEKAFSYSFAGDEFLVKKIASLNGFGAPRTSRESFLQATSSSRDMTSGKGLKHLTSGIWLLASRINHSCVGNCRRSFIGDMQIVRATKELPADTELFFCYRLPVPFESYQETQKGLNHWGFACNCELCLSKKSTSKSVFQRRKVLANDLKRLLDHPGSGNEAKLSRLMKALEKTYPTNNDSAIRLELWEPYFALGVHLLEDNQLNTAAKIILKGFEALGYSIIACPPNDIVDQPRLEVERWGVANDAVPWAFSNLVHVYC
ncbi:TPR domain-containing protein [Fusarium mexicanum]|uniref:TPR domain-containing protein n=1 Tax=Fusarium mexicanum TaxID=751941 RepID=A0A8H5N218_9HYPO|nr:TPR domain-containing protein [Fusarium mexicanum]